MISHVEAVANYDQYRREMQIAYEAARHQDTRVEAAKADAAAAWGRYNRLREATNAAALDLSDAERAVARRQP